MCCGVSGGAEVSEKGGDVGVGDDDVFYVDCEEFEVCSGEEVAYVSDV